MKIIFAILLSFLFLVGCSNHTKKVINTDWIEMEVKEKNCVISFPFDYSKIHNEEYFVENIGKVLSYEVDLNTQNKDDLNLGYKLAIYEYPDFNFYESSEKIEEFLSGTAENLLVALNASRIYEKKINFSGFPGKELYYSMDSQEAYFTTRMYVINGKQYSMTVITNKNNLVNKSITKFFESFKLINNKP
ncbi:hypothetical protein [Draconibacterium sediminis]|uniref:hypothetical protein n=1 Tax=Draconibacterium sediminis TaxID=1544798 RepID=UPI0026ED630B|nr:hypothetical protein [Draconibacterium sediminis]